MDSTPDDPAQALRWLQAHYEAMPPVAAMRLRAVEADADALRLSAPLSAHVNDKGCAFGGSLVSLMTLAGWGLASLRLRAHALQAELFVARSEVRYLAPLYADLVAEARLAEGGWDAFVAQLRDEGRARVTIEASVALPEGGVAATCRSRYVAIATG